MTQITLVTGNPNKLAELQAIFPPELELTHAGLDIVEIQGKPSAIVADKLQKAYQAVGGPVIVEDVSAELGCLGGLPGPYVKDYEKKLGKGALWRLAEHAADKSVVIRCTMGFFDGQTQIIEEGVVKGAVVAPRGENGFGFDFVLVPDGHTKTTAEMSPQEKNQISWRGLAARALAAKLRTK